MSVLYRPPESYAVAVLGAGLMGTRIAGELALAGCIVHVFDLHQPPLAKLRSNINEQLQELKREGLLAPSFSQKGSVIVHSVLAEAVSNANIIIESVCEDTESKNSLFKDVASLVSNDAILCTNTINLPLEEVFADVPHLERVVGLRFLYPVYMIDVVEILPHKDTSRHSMERVNKFLGSISKKSEMRSTEGDYPRKLSETEARTIQINNAQHYT